MAEMTYPPLPCHRLEYTGMRMQDLYLGAAANMRVRLVIVQSSPKCHSDFPSHVLGVFTSVFRPFFVQRCLYRRSRSGLWYAVQGTMLPTSDTALHIYWILGCGRVRSLRKSYNLY